MKANAVLDALVASQSSERTERIHTDTAVEYAVMLALIIVVGLATIDATKPTCGVASCTYPRPSDLYPEIVEQAQHAVDVANQLSAVTP